MNSYKGEHGDVLDPFKLQRGWFALELVEFQVVPSAGLAGDHTDKVQATIRRLRLNLPRFCRIRAEYAEARWRGDITDEYLARHSPSWRASCVARVGSTDDMHCREGERTRHSARDPEYVRDLRLVASDARSRLANPVYAEVVARKPPATWAAASRNPATW